MNRKLIFIISLIITSFIFLGLGFYFSNLQDKSPLQKVDITGVVSDKYIRDEKYYVVLNSNKQVEVILIDYTTAHIGNKVSYYTRDPVKTPLSPSFCGFLFALFLLSGFFLIVKD